MYVYYRYVHDYLHVIPVYTFLGTDDVYDVRFLYISYLLNDGTPQ